MVRRAALAVAAAVLLFAAGFVAAGGGDGDDDRPAEDSVDVGFLQDMVDHHEQAVLLALLVLRGSPSDTVRNFAVDVIASQRHELGLMDGWLTVWGLERGAPGRTAMGWMGMPTPVAAMPGMAGPEDLDALSKASGAELDRLFLRLMLDHHRGGIHMGEFAAAEAGNDHVRWLGGQIRTNQLREIRDMEAVLAGIDPG